MTTEITVNIIALILEIIRKKFIGKNHKFFINYMKDTQRIAHFADGHVEINEGELVLRHLRKEGQDVRREDLHSGESQQLEIGNLTFDIFRAHFTGSDIRPSG